MWAFLKLAETLVIDFNIPTWVVERLLESLPADLSDLEERFLYFDQSKKKDFDDLLAELMAFTPAEICIRYVDVVAFGLAAIKPTYKVDSGLMFTELLQMEGFVLAT